MRLALSGKTKKETSLLTHMIHIHCLSFTLEYISRLTYFLGIVESPTRGQALAGRLSGDSPGILDQHVA